MIYVLTRLDIGPKADTFLDCHHHDRAIKMMNYGTDKTVTLFSHNMEQHNYVRGSTTITLQVICCHNHYIYSITLSCEDQGQ